MRGSALLMPSGLALRRCQSLTCRERVAQHWPVPICEAQWTVNAYTFEQIDEKHLHSVILQRVKENRACPLGKQERTPPSSTRGPRMYGKCATMKDIVQSTRIFFGHYRAICHASCKPAPIATEAESCDCIWRLQQPQPLSQIVCINFTRP